MNTTFGLALDFWNPDRSLSRQIDDYLGLLEQAEGHGFDSVWAGEGHMSAPAPGHVPAPLLLLAAMARSTSLRLGTGVMLLPLRHPLRLAHEAALLDHVCDGRLTLGVAVGHRELMRRYGVPPGEMASRMDETLLVLKKLWRGEREYRGRHFEIEGGVYPKPVQPGGPPLWVGGAIARSIERAAELGDGWYAATEYAYDTIARQVRRYTRALAAQGRDAADGTVCINRTTFLAETDEAAAEEAEPYIRRLMAFYVSIGHLRDATGATLDPHADYARFIAQEYCFVGSPQTCLERIREYRDELGVSHFNFRVCPAGMPVSLATRTVSLLGDCVLPRLAED